MKIKIIVHQDGGDDLWAEVPAIPGCGAEATTMNELVQNLKSAIAENLDVQADDLELPDGARLVEIEV